MRREGVEEPLEIGVTRGNIKLTAARVRTEGDSVVVRVSTFNEQTLPNVSDGMEREIEAAGGLDNINGVVLDLRNNPGGLLTAGVELADIFL